MLKKFCFLLRLAIGAGLFSLSVIKPVQADTHMALASSAPMVRVP